MKNIKKRHQEKMVEWYGTYILRYLQAIEDAGMYVLDMEEVHNGYGDWVYLRLSRYQHDDHTRFYLMFSSDSLIYFYVGEYKQRVCCSRFSPEGLTKFLMMWREMEEHCSNCM